ncbi:MAG: hypothetical protein DWQ34_19035 [Planctomycetota bacterium]|nr:MAG: hypothetical protein DWQ34_19035 [Planctomycetota bacterium]REK24330.1 MAG: hypothetical protein DWQ41_15005 [Planctomycetota bacterium]REK34645.1 MAG: hypothetical protein DWQ45_13180 [Planctomycetota bacterium]
MTTRELIESFHRFACAQVDNVDDELSIDELYSLWRARNPTDGELAESVSAVQEAARGLAAGDTGRPARAELRKACDGLGLIIDE